MTTDVAKNFAWANEQFEHFIAAWSQVAETRSDQASLYLELHDRITSRDGGYVRAMAIPRGDETGEREENMLSHEEYSAEAAPPGTRSRGGNQRV